MSAFDSAVTLVNHASVEGATVPALGVTGAATGGAIKETVFGIMALLRRRYHAAWHAGDKGGLAPV